MVFEHNWRQKSLESLEKEVWPDVNTGMDSYLIKTCNDLRKKALEGFTVEDLRILIGQEIGLKYLMPLAIEFLSIDLFAEGDMYKGDLLKKVLDVDTKFWDEHPDYWQQIKAIIKDRRMEILELNITFSKIDNCKHN